MALYPSLLSSSQPNLRALDLNTDREAVLSLLKIAFQQPQQNLGRRQNSLILLPFMSWWQRLDLYRKGFVPGVVWQEDGQIVGCASLMPAKTIGRFVIANVAVHPDFRQRGIAREVVVALTEHVRALGGKEVRLQVEQKNERAIRIYQRLGFQFQGSTTSWGASPTASRYVPAELLESSSDYIIRELRAGEWKAAKALADQTFAPALQWPDPYPDNLYRTGIVQSLQNFFDGRAVEPWVIQQESGLTGLLSMRSEWMRRHVLQLHVVAGSSGLLERPLLAKAFRLLRTMPRYYIHLDHVADSPIDPLFEQFGFQKQRTLAIMRLPL